MKTGVIVPQLEDPPNSQPRLCLNPGVSCRRPKGGNQLHKQCYSFYTHTHTRVRVHTHVHTTFSFLNLSWVFLPLICFHLGIYRCGKGKDKLGDSPWFSEIKASLWKQGIFSCTVLRGKKQNNNKKTSNTIALDICPTGYWAMLLLKSEALGFRNFARGSRS